MPYIAGLIGALFTSIFGFFVEHMAKRLAVVLTVVAGIALFVVGFFAAILAVIGGLNSVVPPGMSMALSWVVPENLPLIISTILTARVLRWAYEWNVKIIQYRLF